MSFRNRDGRNRPLYKSWFIWLFFRCDCNSAVRGFFLVVYLNFAWNRLLNANQNANKSEWQRQFQRETTLFHSLHCVCDITKPRWSYYHGLGQICCTRFVFQAFKTKNIGIFRCRNMLSPSSNWRNSMQVYRLWLALLVVFVFFFVCLHENGNRSRWSEREPQWDGD